MTASTSRVRVFLASSLDNYIAGPDDDLSWLPQPPEPDPSSSEPPPDMGWAAFLAEVGALLMGRNTYEVVAGFDGPWPYGERPVLVATRRPLQPKSGSVRAVTGDIVELVDEARAAAGGRDVYLDGGVMVRQALAAGLVDELVLTVIPVVLGAGVPLFAGVAPTKLELESSEVFPGGIVQLRYGICR